MTRPMLRACRCEQRRPGSAWIEPLPELRGGERALIACNSCSGVLVVLNDGMGRLTVEAPTEGVLLANFSEWLKQASAEAGLTPQAIAAEIGKPWTRTDPAAGCAHCLAVRAEPYVKGLNHVASGAIWDELYQCPKCGAYRWKTFETHGFAEVEVWGKATREDLKRFQSYLDGERQKRGMSQEDLIEDIFQKCV